MTKTTININERATLEVEGTYTTKSCKTVICLDNGNRYARALDAASANGTTIDGISHNCCGDTKHTNGKHFCYLQNVDEHLNTILDNFNAAVTENEILVTEKKALVTEIAALKAEILELTARNSEYASEDVILRKRIETLNAQNIDLTKEITTLRDQGTNIPADILFKAKEYDRIMARRKAEEKRAKLEEMMRNLAMELEASTAELRALESESVA